MRVTERQRFWHARRREQSRWSATLPRSSCAPTEGKRAEPARIVTGTKWRGRRLPVASLHSRLTTMSNPANGTSGAASRRAPRGGGRRGRAGAPASSPPRVRATTATRLVPAHPKNAREINTSSTRETALFHVGVVCLVDRGEGEAAGRTCSSMTRSVMLPT
jgi:hypothetical protein